MPPFVARNLKAAAAIFRRPFEGLWAAIALYFFWCFLVHPHSDILRGNLPDPDDYMYLDQVLDWLKGQGWYDNIQHRLDPPMGGPIHFSRLAMLPMAALTWLFELCGLKPVGAATVTAAIEPVFLFAGFLLVLREAAAGFVPKEWAGASAYVALFGTGLIALFVPGHVDHHGLILLLLTGALACTLRMMQKPTELQWAAGSGVLHALALTVALEVLPWMVVLNGALGLWAIVKGRAAARSGLVYGLALYLASAVLLLTAKPPSQFLVPDMAAYSIVYVLFTGSIAVIFTGIALGARARASWRWLAGGVLAAVMGLLFLRQFPQLAGDPWNAVNPELAHLILGSVTEAQSLIHLEHRSILLILVYSLYPLFGLGAGIYFLRRTPAERAWPWLLVLALLVTFLVIVVVGQIRYIGMLDMLAALPLTALLAHGWKEIGGRWRTGRARALAEIGLILLVGPLPSVLVPALVDGRSFNEGVLLFPVHRNVASDTCDMFGLEQVLRAPQLHGDKAHIIMNTMGIGPELLFRTPDFVLSAPYHEDVPGNLDSAHFFSASSPEEAEKIIRKRGADLVIACRMLPHMYADAWATHVIAQQKDDGKAYPLPMIVQLLDGHAPVWLKPVSSPALKNYIVYVVAPEARHGKKPKSE